MMAMTTRSSIKLNARRRLGDGMVISSECKAGCF
jgi:hypothetical protein